MELSYIIVWLIWLIILGVITLPTSLLFFKNFYDFGYGLSKTLSLLLLSYFVFLASTFKILPFYRSTIILSVLLLTAFNIYLYFKNKNIVNEFVSKNIKLLVFQEFLFISGVILWTFVRSRQPDINGLEKLMDFGFINTILKAKYFPPYDMWAAGLPINYYWYGHFVTAFITKLSNIPSGVAYNLMLGTILGLSLTSSFSFVSTLISKIKNVSKKAVIVGGILSAILLNFAGNFHTPYYLLKNGLDKYWYPDATRFIGYNPDVDDKTIHEFPIYSYVVSDLHAHLLNLPNVLLFLSLLYLLITPKTINAKSANIKKASDFNNWFNLSTIEEYKVLITLGFVLGIMFITNAWDIANYLLVTGFVLLLNSIRNFRTDKIPEYVIKITSRLLIITVTALVTSLPFLINFQSIAQGVDLTHTKTPIWQLLILWGFPLTLTVFFLGNVFIKRIIKTTDLFITALVFASWVLIFIPEFIYIKDIYAISHYRANTMFKLTYQAYVMFYLTSGYVVIFVLSSTKNYIAKLLLTLTFSLIFASILYYPFLATKSYYGKVFDKNNSAKGLSGDDWIKKLHPETYKLIGWFKENIEDNEQPFILEAPGDSYTDFNTISSYTGLPTISGWYVHEWLWRGSSDFPANRVSDITQIYNTTDSVLAQELLKKYAVKYVIIGKFEREKFPTLNEEKFLTIGNLIFESGESRIYMIAQQ